MHRLVSLLILLASVPAAAVPMNLVHQGRMFDSGGAALDGDHDVSVALFDVETGGTALWSDDFAATGFDQGYYSLDIGSGAALDPAAFDGDDVWLQLVIDSGTPLPRVKLASVPYAIRAMGVAGGVVDASEIRVNGTTIIDSDGNIDGASLPGGDGDTLGDLVCNAGELVVFDGADWQCGTAPSHTHDGSDITSGVLAIERLPIGTGSTEVAAGDHLHGFGQITGQVAFSQLPVGTAATEIAAGDHTHPAGDADTLDGKDSADFADSTHTHPYADSSHTHPAGDADTLDSLDSTDFATAGHAHTAADIGAVSSACTGGNQQAAGIGHCYVRVAASMNFATAQTTCRDLGMHVVTITSKSENDFITGNLTHSGYWIGMSDARNEGQWYWVTGEAGIVGEGNGNYTYWGGAEPNNSNGEDCTQFRSDGAWNDVDCAANLPGVICERDW